MPGAGWSGACGDVMPSGMKEPVEVGALYRRMIQYFGSAPCGSFPVCHFGAMTDAPPLFP